MGGVNSRIREVLNPEDLDKVKSLQAELTTLLQQQRDALPGAQALQKSTQDITAALSKLTQLEDLVKKESAQMAALDALTTKVSAAHTTGANSAKQKEEIAAETADLAAQKAHLAAQKAHLAAQNAHLAQEQESALQQIAAAKNVLNSAKGANLNSRQAKIAALLAAQQTHLTDRQEKALGNITRARNHLRTSYNTKTEKLRTNKEHFIGKIAEKRAALEKLIVELREAHGKAVGKAGSNVAALTTRVSQMTSQVAGLEEQKRVADADIENAEAESKAKIAAERAAFEAETAAKLLKEKAEIDAEMLKLQNQERLSKEATAVLMRNAGKSVKDKAEIEAARAKLADLQQERVELEAERRSLTELTTRANEESKLAKVAAEAAEAARKKVAADEEYRRSLFVIIKPWIIPLEKAGIRSYFDDKEDTYFFQLNNRRKEWLEPKTIDEVNRTFNLNPRLKWQAKPAKPVVETSYGGSRRKTKTQKKRRQLRMTRRFKRSA